MARLSAGGDQLAEEDREAGKLLMAREKSTRPIKDPCKTSR